MKGEIKLNGEPLRWGMIALYPDRGGNAVEESRLPVAFALVSRGKFDIPAARGAPLGNCRLQVVTLGDVQPLPTIENSRELVTLQTGIVLNVAAEGNDFQLDLPDGDSGR